MADRQIRDEEITTPPVDVMPHEQGAGLPPGATQVNGMPGWTSSILDREPHRRGDLRER